jgi:hypothetical protein
MQTNIMTIILAVRCTCVILFLKFCSYFAMTGHPNSPEVSNMYKLRTHFLGIGSESAIIVELLQPAVIEFERLIFRLTD